MWKYFRRIVIELVTVSKVSIYISTATTHMFKKVGPHSSVSFWPRQPTILRENYLEIGRPYYRDNKHEGRSFENRPKTQMILRRTTQGTSSLNSVASWDSPVIGTDQVIMFSAWQKLSKEKQFLWTLISGGIVIGSVMKVSFVINEMLRIKLFSLLSYSMPRSAFSRSRKTYCWRPVHGTNETVWSIYRRPKNSRSGAKKTEKHGFQSWHPSSVSRCGNT